MALGDIGTPRQPTPSGLGLHDQAPGTLPEHLGPGASLRGVGEDLRAWAERRKARADRARVSAQARILRVYGRQLDSLARQRDLAQKQGKAEEVEALTSQIDEYNPSNDAFSTEPFITENGLPLSRDEVDLAAFQEVHDGVMLEIGARDDEAAVATEITGVVKDWDSQFQAALAGDDGSAVSTLILEPPSSIPELAGDVGGETIVGAQREAHLMLLAAELRASSSEGGASVARFLRFREAAKILSDSTELSVKEATLAKGIFAQANTVNLDALEKQEFERSKGRILSGGYLPDDAANRFSQSLEETRLSKQKEFFYVPMKDLSDVVPPTDTGLPEVDAELRRWWQEDVVPAFVDADATGSRMPVLALFSPTAKELKEKSASDVLSTLGSNVSGRVAPEGRLMFRRLEHELGDTYVAAVEFADYLNDAGDAGSGDLYPGSVVELDLEINGVKTLLSNYVHLDRLSRGAGWSYSSALVGLGDADEDALLGLDAAKIALAAGETHPFHLLAKYMEVEGLPAQGSRTLTLSRHTPGLGDAVYAKALSLSIQEIFSPVETSDGRAFKKAMGIVSGDDGSEKKRKKALKAKRKAAEAFLSIFTSRWEETYDARYLVPGAGELSVYSPHISAIMLAQGVPVADRAAFDSDLKETLSKVPAARTREVLLSVLGDTPTAKNHLVTGRVQPVLVVNEGVVSVRFRIHEPQALLGGKQHLFVTDKDENEVSIPWDDFYKRITDGSYTPVPDA